MVTYIGFIAICNIGLGYLLGRWWNGVPQPASPVVGTETTRAPVSTTDLESISTDVPDVEISAVDNTAVASADPDKCVPKTTAQVAPTWEEFINQLRSIEDRARFVRSVDDNRLARDVVNELSNCLSVWHDRLLARLDSVADESLDLPEEWDANTVEMVAAQFESSIGNIRAIDPADSAELIVDALDREFELLNSYRHIATQPVG